MRIINHPILGQLKECNKITIYVDGKAVEALEGDTVASALLANGIKKCRYTRKLREPRGIFCAIGRCNDCIMIIDGIPNTRACVTPVKEGMIVETQEGNGTWEGLDEKS
jgi:predicted molibdopterin-dependent oxidoreductase YjgC